MSCKNRYEEKMEKWSNPAPTPSQEQKGDNDEKN